MDLTTTTIPKSDQINAEDVMLSGPVTVTVESVSKGNAEQPVDIHLVEFPGRAYRPSKTMRRVLVKAWGKESDAYAGHRMTLRHDPDVKFGGARVGGIKISHVSHITKRLELALTETRGKRAVHIIEPLAEVKGPRNSARNSPAADTQPTATDVAACMDTATLRAMWQAAGPEVRTLIEARVAELTSAPAPSTDVEWPTPEGEGLL